MKIYVYNYSKNNKSTAVPLDTGTAIDVTLKEGCSVLNPAFRLTSWPAGSNYVKATLEGVTRYYFVDDVNVESNADRWIQCSLDYLGTWKSMLEASAQFVERSSDVSIINNRLTDPVVKAMNRVDKSYTDPEVNIYDLQTGVFILGLLMDGITNPISRRGSVSYVAMTPAQLDGFITKILTINTSVFSSYAPIQYVVSCVYIPFSIGALTTAQDVPVTFGSYQTDITYNFRTELQSTNGVVRHGIGGLTLPDHPDTTDFGEYVNYAPFTSHKIFAGPFGDFEVDPESLNTQRSLLFFADVDVTDGSAILTVQSGVTIKKIRGCLGVRTSLSQITSNPALGIAQIVAGTFGSIASMAMGNIVGGAAGIVQGGISAINNMIPKVTTQGLNGSMAELYSRRITATSEFLRINGDPIAFVGRPVNKTVTISTIASGSFVKCSNVKLTLIGAYQQELQRVVELMENGFFYE